MPGRLCAACLRRGSSEAANAREWTRIGACLFAAVLLSGVLRAGERLLFNGEDLAGWIHEGDRATFSASDGELRTSGLGNYPNWLHTGREYENFRLRFEYKLAKWAEAAVVLRAPRMGRPMRSGLAVVLAHDFHGLLTEHVTGAVAGVLKPLKALPASFDVWHAVDLLLKGDLLKVTIGGVTVQEIRLSAHPELRHRLKRGFIGFPDLGHAYSIRNVRLQELGFEQKYVELFGGESLRGWELRRGGDWTVRDGAIHASNGHGILYAPGVFEDFEFTALVRSHNRVNSGVFLRGQPEGQPRGVEVQIYSPPDAVYPTGSVYGIQRSRIAADYEQEWFLLQIMVVGARCVVRINGETVAETSELPEEAWKPGRIGLQIHKDNASVEFRDVRVRPL